MAVAGSGRAGRVAVGMITEELDPGLLGRPRSGRATVLTKEQLCLASGPDRVIKETIIPRESGTQQRLII